MPGTSGHWENTQYALDCAPDFEVEWLVVYDGWSTPELMTHVPRARRILITGEPESFHRYQPAYLAQFGHVITTQRCIRHPGVIHTQVGMNWFAGVRFDFNGPQNSYVPVLGFEELAADLPLKTKLCSVVSSTKSVTAGHRQRLDFILRLKEELGDLVDIYGRGFQEVADKDDALAAYRYHIALENSSHPDYWTEKLADPFLRQCFPIYAGCPNLSDYFPEGSWLSIDVSKPAESIARIREVLKSDLDRQRASAVAEAKRRVLWEHNVFGLLERTYRRLESAEAQAPQRLTSPERLWTNQEVKDARWSRRLVRRLRQVLGLKRTGR
ncbi:glycosyltransferase family 10 domain-containing protein [Piscinibacter gummiphilus]|uniref:Glycosyltransferase family 10 n=1 Tax=Piscinibacter gummiphilus TaxID=946333 RepID=A0ABZ0D4V5_9BURK|nr:glycosyltransferase family 10 [Piscinibacter gummiphilus]WOB10078.1 glycosyltransferase family 10 [Piscinibacter gummiphilus]